MARGWRYGLGYRLRVRQELLKSIQALRSLHPRLPLRNMFGGQAVAVWRDRLKVLCFGLKVPVACPIGDRTLRQPACSVHCIPSRNSIPTCKALFFLTSYLLSL